jgi:hypothetical protein
MALQATFVEVAHTPVGRAIGRVEKVEVEVATIDSLGDRGPLNQSWTFQMVTKAHGYQDSILISDFKISLRRKIAMRIKTILMFLMVVAMTSGVWAQTKISGALQCGKADPVYTVPVGDHPDHDFWIGKQKCTWTKSPEIAGTVAKGEEVTFLGDQIGNRARGRGLAVGTMANGDKYFARFQFQETYQAKTLQAGEVTWAYAGGTGKLSGLKGKGTSKCKGAADGGLTCEIGGEYQLPK